MHMRAGFRQFHNIDVRAFRCTGTPPEAGSCFATAPTPFVVWSQPVMRSQRNSLLAICLIFEAARSPSGAAAGGSSWVGRIRGRGHLRRIAEVICRLLRCGRGWRTIFLRPGDLGRQSHRLSRQRPCQDGHVPPVSNLHRQKIAPAAHAESARAVLLMGLTTGRGVAVSRGQTPAAQRLISFSIAGPIGGEIIQATRATPRELRNHLQSFD